tara:strand:- start:269 stop:442 length:174 start_codon:yes stop_codon:yes gene_type:complete
MLTFNESSDITIIRTIESHDNILWAIGKGERGYNEVLIRKQLAEMEAEMQRRYPDAV